MKKAKRTLGLVLTVLSAAALAGCNEVTYSSGNVLTYTDANGNSVSYTADALFNNYQDVTGTASTDFDKVYEVLIRNYFDSSSQASAKAEIDKTALNDVKGVKETAEKNATANGTSYEAEFENLLKKDSVENVDELFNYFEYTAEKTKFESDYYDSNLGAMRDGSTTGLAGTNDIFPASSTYGIANSGWIKERMPYHIRHILVKVSASSGNYTQGEITEPTSPTESGEATKLATVVEDIAAGTKSFGEIAYQLSDDSSSAALYGDAGIMDKSTSFINEFKLGVYAYDSLYNQREKNTDFGKTVVSNITPGLTEDKTAVDSTQILDDTGETINQFLTTGETDDSGTATGIGQIPYGAAVALMSTAKDIYDANGNKVNDGTATFYPRNIIFNKYFNKHNVCVITPNDIPFNTGSYTAGSLPKESFDGTPSAAFEALPGFKTKTTDVLPQFTKNVLTNTEGQIILAVRGGSDSYQGVHFIVVQRDPLDRFGTTYDSTANTVTANATKKTGTSDLSEYYTTKRPGQTGYPTYDKSGTATDLTTYVNSIHQTSSDYQTRSATIVTDIKSYNSSLSTYMLQGLIDGGSITFSDASVGAKVASYVKNKRAASATSDFTTWTTTWKTYAELLEQQNEARTLGTNGTGYLISETCAIGFKNANKTSDSNWLVGGGCYYDK